MYNIGFHTWDPALLKGYEADKGGSTAGSAAWINKLWQHLAINGHRVYWLGEGKTNYALEFDRRDYSTFKSLDIVVMYYRWTMKDSKERHESYLLQQTWMRSCASAGIPFIVFDGDHMLDKDEAMKIQHMGGFIAAPELNPQRSYVRPLLFPNPYQFKSVDVHPSLRPSVIYVGNNYGRYDQSVSFFKPLSKKYDVTVYGNWLEESPGRESPYKVKRDMPRVHFAGRLQQTQIIERLSKSKFTVHLCKPSYEKSGFCTMRWAEAASAGAPAFVPSKFSRISNIDMINAYVEDGGHIVNVMSRVAKDGMPEDVNLLDDILSRQREFVSRSFRVENWEHAIHDCIEGNWL